MDTLTPAHFKLLHAALGLSYYVSRPTRRRLPDAEEKAHQAEVIHLAALGYLKPETTHGEGGADRFFEITDAGEAIALANRPEHHNPLTTTTKTEKPKMTTTAPRASRAKKTVDAAPAPDTKTGDLLAAVEPQKPGSELTVLPPAARAAVVIKSDVAEQNLRALMKKSAEIKEVKDKAGRALVHRMAMDLKDARVAIKNAGEVAREDANAFSRAVVAEVARLAAISKEEEDRVFKLRDDFDAEQARIEKEEKERNEARIAAIRAKIDAITDLTTLHAAADSETLKGVLTELAARVVTADEFAEFVDQANAAINTTGKALVELLNGATAREQAEAERVRAAEEERQRIEAEKEANRVAAARLAEQQAAAERQQQEVAQAAAQLKAAQDQQARTIRTVEVFNYATEIEGTAFQLAHELERANAHKIDADELGAGVGMAKMARDIAIATLTRRVAQAVAEELPAAHAEALEMNAQFDAPQVPDAEPEAQPEAYYYSQAAFRDDVAPAPAACDTPQTFEQLTTIEGLPTIREMAAASESAPEPLATSTAPLPYPEGNLIDEQINAGLIDGPTDAEILELIECEYGWSRDESVQRLRVVLASYEERAAA